MPEAETGAFQGALIKESLKDDTVLDFVGNLRRGAMADARYPALLDGNHLCLTALRFAIAGAKKPFKGLVCRYEAGK